jgi:hypothetical protein
MRVGNFRRFITLSSSEYEVELDNKITVNRQRVLRVKIEKNTPTPPGRRNASMAMPIVNVSRKSNLLNMNLIGILLRNNTIRSNPPIQANSRGNRSGIEMVTTMRQKEIHSFAMAGIRWMGLLIRLYLSRKS